MSTVVDLDQLDQFHVLPHQLARQTTEPLAQADDQLGTGKLNGLSDKLSICRDAATSCISPGVELFTKGTATSDTASIHARTISSAMSNSSDPRPSAVAPIGVPPPPSTFPPPTLSP